MMHRLDAQAGEWLDRSVPLRFTFEGREYQGFSGDTVSSALAAAGLALLARSFKYHRPRSILSFANHDSNTLFQVDGVPNMGGDVTLLRAATPKRYGFCDVLVIGAGPSGLAAALAAAQSGAQVVLVDESLRLAGNGAPPALVGEAHRSSAITLYPATVAAGYY